MATPIITEKEIRMFIMDKPELNPLLAGVKFDSTDIDNGIINVISYFNEIPPYTGTNYTVENFPFRYILLIGLVGHLLKGAAVNEAVNQFDYSVEGVQVNDKNKAGLFTQLGNEYWSEFKDMVKQVKVSQNVNQLYNSFSSEYIRR